MNKKVTISVAMATYNGEKFLREQLDSICMQTLPPDELVISDDCSTDSTIDIINKYKNRINIKIVKNEKNHGVNSNFENAIRNCSCDYIAICDQDDVWLSGKLKAFYDCLSTEKSLNDNYPILVSSECTCFSGDVQNPLPEVGILKIVKDKRNFLFSKNFHCQGCSFFMNRDLINILPRFQPDFKIFPYDCLISIVAAQAGLRYHLENSLMMYRQHDNNIVGMGRILPIKERIKLRMHSIIYSLFGIPLSRQKQLIEISQTLNDNYFIGDVNEGMKNIYDYYFGNMLKKIAVILDIPEVDFNIKITQIIKLVGSYPLRLFVTK